MSDPITRLNAALEGRYRIESELGEGGMATVYLADDLRHERKVALKVLMPELAAVVGAERFLAEIKTTANLQHPHILPLFDSGEADTYLFYVMPYVEGETLRDRLDREHQLPVDDAVQIAKNVAEALDYAHKQGVIHRDIKPANILLQAGKPVISDFGIALAVGVAGAGRMTETGLSLGTPHYMSPEQATGDLSVGAATDVYALGCVLYETLVGDPPYVGSTAQAILGKIVTGDADPVTKHRRSVPANVDAAIRKALEKVPADRFTEAQEFAGALGDAGFRHGELGPAVAAASPVLWKSVSGLLAATTVLAVSWAVTSAPADEALPVIRVELTLGEYGVSSGSNSGVDLVISADGSRIVYRGGAVEGGAPQLWERRMVDLVPHPIPGTAGMLAPAISPDGSFVVFNSARPGGGVFIKDLEGGPPTQLVPEGVGASFGTDGMIYYRRGNSIWRVAATGGEPQQFAQMEGAQLRYPDPLPDGRGLLVTIGRGNVAEQSGIGVVGPEGGEARELFAGAMARYAESGHIVYTIADGTLMAAPFDVRSLQPTGPAVAMLEGVLVKESSASQFDLSETGMLVYASGNGGGGVSAPQQLLVVDFDGTETVLPLPPRAISAVSWSPDGRSVVYSSDGQIWTYNTLRDTPTRQVTFEGDNRDPVLSPDGTEVVFSSVREGTDLRDLFVKNLDDDVSERSIVTLEGTQRPMQWPSDSLIVFGQGDRGSRQVWTVNLSDPANARVEPYPSPEADFGRLVVSPDGTLAAYVSTESERNEVYIRSFPNPGAPTRVSEGGGNSPFWSPDGNTVYYWSVTRVDVGGGVDRTVDLFTAARLQRNPTPVVVDREPLFTGSYSQNTSALHPDGDRIIVAQLPAASETGNGDAVSFVARPIVVTNFFEELRERLGEN